MDPARATASMNCKGRSWRMKPPVLHSLQRIGAELADDSSSAIR